MASGDNLEILLSTFGALTDCGETSSLLVSENEHNNFVGVVPLSTTTSDEFSSPLMDNSNTDQGTLTRTSTFDQETAIVTQNQSFHQEDSYSKYFNTPANFHDMSSCVFSSGQRENIGYSGNCVPTLSNQMMTTGLQSLNLQHGSIEQSYRQPLLSQTMSGFSNGPYVSTMVTSDMQGVEKANEPTNLNLIQHGFQDHYFRRSLYQKEQFDHNDSLPEQLLRIHEIDHQMQLPKFSNMSAPTSVLGNYSPLMQTSYQPDSLANAFQNSSSLKPPRRPRGRPRRYQSTMPSSLTNTAPKNMSLVPRTQTLLTPPRSYGAQDKGKHVIGTTIPSLNQTLYNQYQNSHTNSLIQQSGGLRQRSFYDLFENEGSSSKIRRIMFPFQEPSIAASSVISPWQDGNVSSNGAAINHEERLRTKTLYDPFYAGVGLPTDPYLRFFR